jgi:hypothetical protein
MGLKRQLRGLPFIGMVWILKKGTTSAKRVQCVDRFTLFLLVAMVCIEASYS